MVTDRSAYEFADVRVDLARMGATRAGAAIPLEPKAFDVLVFLIEHRDRLVTKDEALDAVWAGTFVTPNVLTRAIAQIRKGLGDESQDARYIETVAKRGYRFIAPVTVVPPADGVPAQPAARELSPRAAAARDPRRLWWAVVPLLALAAVGAVVIREKGRPPDAAPADVSLRRLTSRRGYNGNPALSPDGRSVVFASDKTGGLELYLISPVDGSADVALTNDGGQNVQPSWSSDGQWIAFHSRRRHGVWIIPSIGGVPQQVVEFGSDPAWSPDGARLVFTSDAGGLAGQSSLWTVRRDGSDRRPLTQIGKPVGGHRSPSWSHDGRRVVFVVSSGRWAQEIWMADVDSPAVHKISQSINSADPVFAADDRAIYWGGMSDKGNGRLFKRAIDANGNPTGSDEVVVPMDGGIVNGVTLASNGTLAFSVGSLDDNLWAVDVKADGRGGEAVRLTDDVSRDADPDYSHDGRVAFMQVSVGSSPSVWIMREDGTARTALVAGTGSSNPRWTKDGSRMLVSRESPSGWELAWVDVASRRITPTGLAVSDIMRPRLSPDAQTLAFHIIEPDGRLSVWTGRFDGSRTRVATDPEAVSYPAWSPDGQTLALEVKRGDSTHIGIVPATGGPMEELTTQRGQSWPHSWAPDNDRIVFAGERDGIWNVYTVSRRTRAITQVTSFTAGTGFVRYPSWSPAGSRVVFERALESANVWTMTLPHGGE